MRTLSGKPLSIRQVWTGDITTELLERQGVASDGIGSFFDPKMSDLSSPWLLPDIEKAVDRILRARDQKERVVIFGDYDVDGVSSTALLVRALARLDIPVSYRLPHRVHDGYGLKSYFFDELAQKDVKLVITVDCGTRDIEPIRHAATLGIDVIVTDHHAVPETIPEEVIAIINPKRTDQPYHFPHFSGSGVALKLVQALSEKLGHDPNELLPMIELASLGTVSDCMPLIGENRTIVTLGLRAMAESTTPGIRQFLAGRDDEVIGNADIIGFQIGPRINAAGRIDTPMTALRWLLAGDEKASSLFEELDALNERRKEVTEGYLQAALESVDTTQPVLIYVSESIEHGVIGLVAGKLATEYQKPSIVLKNEGEHMVASCRTPEWCHIIELLDTVKPYFLRYGGHKQAAGFTIRSADYESFQRDLTNSYHRIHGHDVIPQTPIEVECILPPDAITLDLIAQIDRFRPFGIGNRRPRFLLQDVTITLAEPLGKDQSHLKLMIAESRQLKILGWGLGHLTSSLQPGDITSLIVELEKEVWNGRTSIKAILTDVIRENIDK